MARAVGIAQLTAGTAVAGMAGSGPAMTVEQRRRAKMRIAAKNHNSEMNRDPKPTRPYTDENPRDTLVVLMPLGSFLVKFLQGGIIETSN